MNARVIARATSCAAAMIATIAVVRVAIAHTNPARRSVAVQAERNAIVMLVTWTVPSGEPGEVYAASAAWGRRGADGRKALQASLAAKAIGPLTLTLDGVPVASPEMKVKLTEDPPGSGRAAVAVLLSATIPAGEHTASISIRPDSDPTRVMFVDRSAGRAGKTWVAPDGDTLDETRPVTITWTAAEAVDAPR